MNDYIPYFKYITNDFKDLVIKEYKKYGLYINKKNLCNPLYWKLLFFITRIRWKIKRKHLFSEERKNQDWYDEEYKHIVLSDIKAIFGIKLHNQKLYVIDKYKLHET